MQLLLSLWKFNINRPPLQNLVPKMQVPAVSTGAESAALPAAHLHLVLGLPTQVFQIQDSDEDCLQNRGSSISIHR